MARQYSLPGSSRSPIARLVAAVVSALALALAAVVGAVVFLVALGVMAIVFGAIWLRLAWLRRQMRKGAARPGHVGARPSGVDAIDGEFRVIDPVREDGAAVRR